MRVNRGLLNWGVFFVALGAVPLLVRNGTITGEMISDAWRLWPLILVGIGLGLVLRLTALAWLGGVLVAGTFGLMFGALLSGSAGAGLTVGCVGSGPTETSSRSGIAAGETFDLRIELTCGDVTVERGSASSWVVNATHGEGAPPVIEGSSTSLDVRPAPVEGVFPFTDQAPNSWEITVPSGQALSVGLTINAGSGDLTLGPGPVASIGATLNAGDMGIDLSEADTPETASLGMTLNAGSTRITLPVAALTGGMTLNAASLKLCVAEEAALRIRHEGTLSSDDFAGAGLEQTGDAWQTPGYETASPRIDLDITSTVSSIQLDRSGGCS